MLAACLIREAGEAAALFASVPCLRGEIAAALAGRMGRVLADRPERPRAAVAAAGDFLVCGGSAGLSAAHLLRAAMSGQKRAWIVYAPGSWQDALARVTAFHPEERIAFDSAVQPEDSRLRRLVAAAPAELRFPAIAGDWIARCRTETWSRDFVAEFPADGDFAAFGLGVLAVRDGIAVAGASSYLRWQDGIEVQVQTREGYEGRGYATLAAAALILRAQARGLHVCWDAANPASARIAEKLGFRRVGEYAALVTEKQNVC